MKHRRTIITALIIGVALIAGAFVVSVYVQPILPSSINSQLIVFFLAVGGVITVLGAGVSGLNDLLDLRRKLRANDSGEVPKLVFEISKQFTGLNEGGIMFKQREAFLEPKLIVNFVAHAKVENQGAVRTSLRFFVEDVEPNCLLENTTPSDIRLTLLNRQHPNQLATELENPYYLQSYEMNHSLQISFSIPFSVPSIEKALGSLASFTTARITIGAESTGRKPIMRLAKFDLKEVHQRIESEVENKLQHCESQQLSARQIMQVLKQYWRGAGEKSS